MSYTYTIILRKEPEGGYAVLVPALPGCLTSGETVEEALTMAREVIPLFLEVWQEDGKTVPPDKPDVRLNMREMEEALVYRLTIEEFCGVVR